MKIKGGHETLPGVEIGPLEFHRVIDQIPNEIADKLKKANITRYIYVEFKYKIFKYRTPEERKNKVPLVFDRYNKPWKKIENSIHFTNPEWDYKPDNFYWLIVDEDDNGKLHYTATNPKFGSLFGGYSVEKLRMTLPYYDNTKISDEPTIEAKTEEILKTHIRRKYDIPSGNDFNYGGNSKLIRKSLDKCTVAELKARADKRGVKVTGLKKSEIIIKLRK